MNNCSFCNYDLVNILYGIPGEKAIALAKEEGIALAGKAWSKGMPTLYCYGCHEVY